MSKIKFQILSSQEDLENYQECTAAQVDVLLPMSYLEKARVVGLKSPHTGQLFGGFTMAYQGPLRALSQLPEEVKEHSPILRRYNNQFFEINGMWLNHKKAPDNSRLQLYLHCMREASLLALKGKTKYVYAYCAENQKLKDFYKNFNSMEIYEGPVRHLPGMKEAGLERVEMGCMKRLPLTILRNPLFLIKRTSLKRPKTRIVFGKKSNNLKEKVILS